MDTQKLKQNFIEKAKKVHGDKYNYNSITYINCKTEIELTCPIHGKFKITPDYHIRGGGCPLCIKKGAKKINTEYWIEKAKLVHGNKYDYSKVNYKKASEPVIIICPKHGEFLMTPNNHLNNHGCPKCAIEIRGYKKRLNLEQFIEKARKIHGDRYDYSKVDYINGSTKVCIICPEHGEFWQTPENHANSGKGCPKCNRSHGESYIEQYLKENSINYICQYEINISKDINVSGKAYIDFYLPDYNLFIEYNGEQHYIPMRFSGGEIAFEHQQLRDLAVNKYCNDNNINLLEISYKINNKDKIYNYMNKYFKNV